MRRLAVGGSCVLRGGEVLHTKTGRQAGSRPGRGDTPAPVSGPSGPPGLRPEATSDVCAEDSGLGTAGAWPNVGLGPSSVPSEPQAAPGGPGRTGGPGSAGRRGGQQPGWSRVPSGHRLRQEGTSCHGPTREGPPDPCSRRGLPSPSSLPCSCYTACVLDSGFAETEGLVGTGRPHLWMVSRQG